MQPRTTVTAQAWDCPNLFLPEWLHLPWRAGL